jgi:glyoxylase-like metal-dependent hydrolase (beta-lactamase superfamily II)
LNVELSNSFQISGLMMDISGFTGGMASTNGYLIRSSPGNWLVDAPEGVAQWLQEQKAKVDTLLLTHQHYDHITDAAEIARDHGARLMAWWPYDYELTLAPLLEMIGMPVQVAPYAVDEVLEGKAEVEVCRVKLKLEHIPGHSLDSVVFIANDDVVFGGDVLFSGSIGRTDFPGGSTEMLVTGIQHKLFTLPDDFKVLPGHGPITTIGEEKQTNPYVQD